MSDSEDEVYEVLYDCIKCGKGWKESKNGCTYSEEEIEEVKNEMCPLCAEKKEQSDKYWSGEQGKTYKNHHGGYDWNNKDA